MVASPAPEETNSSPRTTSDAIRARLRTLIHNTWRSLALAQPRCKRDCDARVRPVNKDVQAREWVFVDEYAQNMYKQGTRAAGPYKLLSRGEGTFSLDIGGYPETVSSNLRGLRGTRGRRRWLVTPVNPLMGISPALRHPRVGLSGRPSQGAPLHAARAPTSRRSGVGFDFLAKKSPSRDTRLSSFESWRTFGQQHGIRCGPRGRGGDHHCRAAGW